MFGIGFSDLTYNAAEWVNDNLKLVSWMISSLIVFTTLFLLVFVQTGPQILAGILIIGFLLTLIGFILYWVTVLVAALLDSIVMRIRTYQRRRDLRMNRKVTGL